MLSLSDEVGALSVLPLWWYALRVKPQHEKSAAASLENKGFPYYLPLYRSRRRWSDRFKELHLPLFPGYLFCRFSLRHRLLVETTPGVRSIVSCTQPPEPVPDSEIAALRTMLASGLTVAPWPFLKVGNCVYIDRGPLCGLEGILIQIKSTWRLVVSVDLLQRSVAVEVDREAVCLTSSFRPRSLPGTRPVPIDRAAHV